MDNLICKNYLRIFHPKSSGEILMDILFSSYKLLNGSIINVMGVIISNIWILRGHFRKPVEQFLKSVDAITLNDITKIAQKIISSPLTMASYGDGNYSFKFSPQLNTLVLDSSILLVFDSCFYWIAVINVPSYESVSRKFHAKWNCFLNWRSGYSQFSYNAENKSQWSFCADLRKTTVEFCLSPLYI